MSYITLAFIECFHIQYLIQPSQPKESMQTLFQVLDQDMEELGDFPRSPNC